MIQGKVTQGKVELEMQGMTGPNCKSVLDKVAEIAKLTTVTSRVKDEYHIEVQQNTQTEMNG